MTLIPKPWEPGGYDCSWLGQANPYFLFSKTPPSLALTATSQGWFPQKPLGHPTWPASAGGGAWCHPPLDQVELHLGQEPAQEEQLATLLRMRKRGYFGLKPRLRRSCLQASARSLESTICPDKQANTRPSNTSPLQLCGGLSGPNHSNLTSGLAWLLVSWGLCHSDMSLPL